MSDLRLNSGQKFCLYLKIASPTVFFLIFTGQNAPIYWTLIFFTGQMDLFYWTQITGHL